MSRFNYYESDGDYPWQFWEQATNVALTSKRGLATLREMETALLSLPQPRLIEGHIAKDGEVCAVGAYALFKKRRDGRSRASVLQELEHECGDHGGEWGDECDDGEYRTTVLAEGLGMARTLAYAIAYRNDEDYGSLAPEQRWTRTLEWVRRKIALNPHALEAS